MGKPRIKARIPFDAYILVGIVLIGALLVGVFREGLSGILYEPLQTPETWLSNHPYISIGNIILDQPGSTIIVYLLALLTILVGIFFIRTQNGQQSRFWWGLFLIAFSVPGGIWTVISPIIITLVLLKMTGVALTERTIVEHRPGYRDYQRRTSTFIPWLPKKAGQ